MESASFGSKESRTWAKNKLFTLTYFLKYLLFLCQKGVFVSNRFRTNTAKV